MQSIASRRGAARVWAVVLCLLVGVVAATVPTVSPARADEVTVSADNQRTAWDQNEPALSPGAVTGSNFGQLFSTALNGQIYAQPLVIGSTVIVATEENYVYGLDSETGAILWHTYLGPSWPASTVGCGDLVPDIGVTSTPVYDPSSGTVYLTAKVNDGATATSPHYYLYALNASSGTVRTGWPVTIGGSPSNDSGTSFNAEMQLQRVGLLLQNGSVYLAFGGHCDHRPYRGYVVGVNTSTHAQHLWTTEAGANASGSGIWQSGGGIVSDGSNGMFIATGNGVTPPSGPGTSPPNTLSESVVHLAVAADGTISASDFFSPANAATLDANDQDLASGAPVALPPAEFGTAAHPNLLAQIGKDGRLFLLDQGSLGGRGQGTGGTDQVVGETSLSGVWGHPAVWGGDGGYLYVNEAYGHLVALGYGLSGTGLPSFHAAGNSAVSMGYTSGSPVVTSDGTASGSALVWAVDSSGPTGANGQLMVYSAVPSNGVLTLLRSWPLGTVSKFSVPATDNGRVYVGTRDGNLIAFGAPTTQALQGAAVGFGTVQVGSTGSATATLTASRTVTISAVAASAPFAAGTTTPALPVTLTAGQTLTVPVTYSPTSPGETTDTLSLTTDQGTIAIGLSGDGVQAGLTAAPGSLDWGQMPVGSSETLTVGVTNTSTSTETFTGVTGPSGPFSASGLPSTGSTIGAGVSETISVTYTPTTAGTDSSSIVLTSDQGPVTIPLTGKAIDANPQVTITPMSLSFGKVAVGQSATQTFTVTNTGNINLTVTKAAPPTAPFFAVNPIPEDQQLTPGESYTISLTFAPTAATDYADVYEVSTDTGQGAMEVALTGSGVGSEYTPYGPTRILDTRWGVGGLAAKVATGGHVALKIAGNGSIPAGVTAVALNVTVTDTVGNGYVSVEPDGVGASNSNLNYLAGQTRTNYVIVPVAANGAIDLYDVGPAHGSVDLIADVSGYFTATSGSGYASVTPARILDTRYGIGAASAKPLASNAGLPVGIVGADSIPTGVSAVALHVTVADATGNGWIAAEADGAGTPTTSILNYLKGQTVSNTVIVPVAADGKIELYNGGGKGTVDLIGDVAGYFSAGSSEHYVPVTPYRAWDSRAKGTALVPNGTTTYALDVNQSTSQQQPIPAGATLVTNITVTDLTANGFVTAFPAGTTRPGVSNLNYLAGQTVAGMSLLATTGAQQQISLYNQSSGRGDVILDVFGYFAS